MRLADKVAESGAVFTQIDSSNGSSLVDLVVVDPNPDRFVYFPHPYAEKPLMIAKHDWGTDASG